MENFRQANRRVANVEACKASAESPDAETRRSKAATVVNANPAPAKGMGEPVALG
jgi:hypothetical protein